MLRGDILQTSRAHRARPENDLTRPGVEGFEKLDNTRHRICREQAEVDDHFEVVSEEEQHLLGGGNRKVASLLDTEVLPDVGCSICSRARARGRRSRRRRSG